MAKQKTITTLKQIARQVRKDIMTMAYEAKSAHSGGALSCVEILVALYFARMKIFPNDPENPLRDRLIFSKAHDVKALYAVLSEAGFFPKDQLHTYEQDQTQLGGHSIRHSVAGVEVSAGSLGHGLPMAVGMAYAAKLDHQPYQIYALLSDGECQEGTTWESALLAAQLHLDNLTVIVDYNKLQGFGFIQDILPLEPFAEKWQVFGWGVKEVDGHSFDALLPVLHALPFQKHTPSVLLAHTIKGKGGVKKHVNQISSQYKPPTTEEYEEFMNTIDHS